MYLSARYFICLFRCTLILFPLSSVICEANPYSLLNDALVLWLPIGVHQWATLAEGQGTEGKLSLDIYSHGTLLTEWP